MEAFDFVENPGKEPFDELAHDITIKNGWGRIMHEYDMWTESRELYWLLVAYHKATKEAVGGIGIAMDRSYTDDDELYYLGSFYTKPQYRGIGLGKELFRRAMEKTKGKNVALNSAVHMISFYQQHHGFVHSRDCCNQMLIVKRKDFYLNDLVSETDIKDLNEVDISEVIGYDKIICPREREPYFKRWIAGEDATCKIAVDSKGKITGVVGIRPQLTKGFTIGPLYADTENIALNLLAACLKAIPKRETHEEHVWMWASKPNEAAVRRIMEKLTQGKYMLNDIGKTLFTQKMIDISNSNKVYGFMEYAHSIV